MNKLFLMTIITFSSYWAMDNAQPVQKGGADDASLTLDTVTDTTSIEILPVVTIDGLTDTADMAFTTTGGTAETIITLTTTANTALSVAFDADLDTQVNADVSLVFTNVTNVDGGGAGDFTAGTDSEPFATTPVHTATANKVIPYGTAQATTKVTLTGTYGADNATKQTADNITVTATITDGGDT
jgi:hypothetical protein